MRPEHERTRRHACTDKIRYETMPEAIAAVRAVRARQRREAQVPDMALRAFRCAFSAGDEHFHIGHAPSVHGMYRLARAMRDLPPPRRSEPAPA